MKIELWQLGKTQGGYLETGIDEYLKRLKHYAAFEVHTLMPTKEHRGLQGEALKLQEGKQVLERLRPGDYLILLDEHGKLYRSVEFAGQLEKWMAAGHKRLIFLVGGAFGFSPELYERAQAKFSLSPMTFSHQMVRLFFAEQLYRAFSILRNEPYHNE
jgi:23S rRNA (pseudouridine1915-N3)-methyltransferase